MTSASPLTARENEILVLIAAGKRTPQIAEALGMSPETVRAHRKNMFRKAGVQSVGQLVDYAWRVGIVKP